MDINASTYSDYMMIISPPAQVKDVISKYKRSTARVIGAFDGMHSIAHISITRQDRQMPVMMMQKLNCYQKTITRLKPVTIRVNGFNYFTHGHTGATIYAKIELDAEINNWLMQLKRVFGDKKKLVPHITVAKNIPVDQFKTLWPYFNNSAYQQVFIPDNLTVLSRPMIGGTDHKWAIFKELTFKK